VIPLFFLFKTIRIDYFRHQLHTFFLPFNINQMSRSQLRLIVLFLFPIAGLQAQYHQYYFNNTLNEQTNGPTLNEVLSCGATNGSFAVQAIQTSNGLCTTASSFLFNDGDGLSYPNSLVTNQYTIEVFCKFNTVNGWTRIIDFSNSTQDAGIYLLNNCLYLYPNGSVGLCNFVPNLYYLFAFVRNGSTGIISIYVNGVLFSTYDDSATNLYKPALISTPIIFFRDDNTVACESESGAVKYVSVTPNLLTAAQIDLTYQTICATISLPVELISFTGAYNSTTSNNELYWKTTSELNSDHIEIEKSTDNSNWKQIGVVLAKPKSSETNEYHFTDPTSSAGINYYRLKLVDKNGSFTYSTILTLSHNELKEPLLYPNPANDLIELNASFQLNDMNWSIYSAIGTLVESGIGAKNGISISALKNGVYYLQLFEEDQQTMIQFVVQH